jgi:DNA polymerase III alpha subunit
MPDLPDLSPAEKLLEEIGAFGFCVTANPLSLVTPDRRIVASGMMKEHAGKTVTMLGIRISSKRVPGKDGNVMEFISFLDLEGWFEAFLPSRAHARLAPLLHRSSAFYVTGRVRDDFGALTLDIHGMEPVRLRACAPALENAV